MTPTIEVVQSITLTIMMIVVSLAVIVSLIFLILTVRNHYKIKAQMAENKREYEELKKENQQKTVDYTEKTLSMTKTMIGQIAVLKFRTWKDGHDLTKVNLPNLRDLANEVAISINQSINRSNIVFDDAIFTEKFFDEYIIETAFILIKDMYDKTIAEID